MFGRVPKSEQEISLAWLWKHRIRNLSILHWKEQIHGRSATECCQSAIKESYPRCDGVISLQQFTSSSRAVKLFLTATNQYPRLSLFGHIKRPSFHIISGL